MNKLFILLAIIFLLDFSVAWKCRRRRRPKRCHRPKPWWYRPRPCRRNAHFGNKIHVEKNVNSVSGHISNSNMNLSNKGIGNKAINIDKDIFGGW